MAEAKLKVKTQGGCAVGLRRVSYRMAGLLLASIILAGCGARATPSALLPTRTLPPFSEPPATRTPTSVPAATPARPAPATATSAPQTGSAPATPMPAARRTSLALCDGSQYNLGTPAPMPAGTPGRIVFMTLDGDIALIDPASGQPVLVTNDALVDERSGLARFYQNPTFSPDGRQLAFVGVNLNAATETITRTVYVAPAQPQAQRITLHTSRSGPIPYLDWAPNGQQVAFLTFDAQQQTGELRVAGSDGAAPGRVDVGQSAYWHWRADSGAIVARMGRQAGATGAQAADRLIVIDTIRQSARTLDITPGAFKSPHYSPDGRYMLFVARYAGQDELALADAEGQPICAIAPINNIAAFAWSPDGRRVAWLDAETTFTSPTPLFMADLRTGQRGRIHDRASAFFWSPDGGRLAVYSLVTGTPPANIEEDVRRAGSVSAEEDTLLTRIEIVDARNGSAVQVADTLPTREFAQYLAYFDQYSRSTTPWSPDGRRLVFFSILSERQTVEIGVATLSASGAAVTIRRLVTGANAFWSPR